VIIWLLAEFWLQDHLQKRLQPEESIQIYTLIVKMDALPIHLIERQVGILSRSGGEKGRLPGSVRSEFRKFKDFACNSVQHR
jgi:hypothetical protein